MSLAGVLSSTSSCIFLIKHLILFSETGGSAEVYESDNIRRCTGNPSFSASPKWQHVCHWIQLKNTQSLSVPRYISTQVGDGDP